MRVRLPILLALALLAAACNQPGPRRESAPLYFPPLPEQPRFQFDGTLRNAASIRRSSEAEDLRTRLTRATEEELGLAKPLAVAARGGRIYVSDSEERRVVVFDVPRGKVFAFGHRGAGRLAKPAGVAVDASGRVYVADVTARRVHVYDALGLHLRTLGGEADLARPTGLAVTPAGDRVYVVDTGGVESDRHRVVVYGADGARLFTIGRRGSAPGEFNLPVDAAIAPDGTLHVLDAGNFRVQSFDRDGRWLAQFGSVGSGLGQLARPRGIACDGEGRLYVSDAAFRNVQIFERDGKLLLAIGRHDGGDAPGNYRLPAGLAVDETRRLYVVDQFYNKVEVLRGIAEREGRRLAGLPN